MEIRQLKIRSAADSDRDAIWNIFHEVVAAGDTYALDPKMSREEALNYWFGPGTRTYVAEQHAESVGEGVTFPGTATPSPTAPVKNRLVVGTYILRANQAGPGAHVRAIHLWEQLGFKIVGTLPDAFRHPEAGYVDVYVMFRSLL